MLHKLARLFMIKTRFEASAITYALALGAAERGQTYLIDHPGWGGALLFLACLASVALASAKIFDCLRHERQANHVTDGMASAASFNEYRLCFGDNARQVNFEARGITRALMLAQSILREGQSATLYEDGVAIGRLTKDGISLFPAKRRRLAIVPSSTP